MGKVIMLGGAVWQIYAGFMYLTGEPSTTFRPSLVVLVGFGLTKIAAAPKP